MSTQRATNEALKAWMASRPEEEQQVVALKMFVSAHASQARFDVEECGSMYKYEIILYWSNADSAFVAEVPELPGCMAHGDTQDAALRNVTQAMEL